MHILVHGTKNIKCLHLKKPTQLLLFVFIFFTLKMSCGLDIFSVSVTYQLAGLYPAFFTTTCV